uniref:GPI inositol-deacylase n=1 Tax=Heterorhabditis bacteriophora TaxID=37862 RepID=A0A1I7W653_HETBA
MISKKSLRELGYHFNSSGEMRSIEVIFKPYLMDIRVKICCTDNQRFKFTTQLAYEKVGNAMIEELYSLMENRYNLKRLPLKPLDSQIQDDRVSFIFASPDFENKDILLVLIHGMGAVRAGQWGRRLVYEFSFKSSKFSFLIIITSSIYYVRFHYWFTIKYKVLIWIWLILNENLDRGSQLPYIERALKNGWGVIVLNTNNNLSNVEEEDRFLKFSRNSEQHTYNTYVRFIEKSNNRVIHVVAHSRGGSDISYLINRCHNEKRLGVVCLTDSWFKFLPERTHYPIIINWTTSKHVDQIIECQKTSKGHVIYQLYAGQSALAVLFV